MSDVSENTDVKIVPEDNAVSLSDEAIITVTEALQQDNRNLVFESINELSDVQTAELISKVTDEERQEIITNYSDAISAETYTELDEELQKQSLESLPFEDVVAIMSELDNDDALALLEPLDPVFQKKILRKLTAKDRAALEEGLSFPEDSAGRLMQRDVVTLPHFWTVGKTLDYMREVSEDLPDDFFDAFIIDPTYHIVGHIPLSNLVRAERDEKMSEICLPETITIPALMDQEEVANIFRRENLTSAPVVDENGRVLGVITIDDIVDVIDEEAQEDILKLAGVERGDMYRAVLSTTSTRFRWLFVNLLTAIFASIIIGLFDATIEQVVALAILMPIVASMGGNAGTQTLTVAVRALSTRELSGMNARRMIWKETLVGALNGVGFALIAGVVTTLWFQNITLGIVIAIAMILTLLIAGLSGAAIPIALDKMGKDPAVASTVFLTTITDVVGFFVFLGLASIILL